MLAVIAVAIVSVVVGVGVGAQTSKQTVVTSAGDTVDLDSLRLSHAYASVGFDTRRNGGNGTFLDQWQIDKSGASRFTDLFRTIPGFRLQYVGSRTLIASTRGGKKCVTYWLDKVRWHDTRPTDANDIARPREVAALEAYPGVAPAEFANHQGCATVVIWTKTRLGVQ